MVGKIAAVVRAGSIILSTDTEAAYLSALLAQALNTPVYFLYFCFSVARPFTPGSSNAETQAQAADSSALG
jgi:hypothetical protein